MKHNLYYSKKCLTLGRVWFTVLIFLCLCVALPVNSLAQASPKKGVAASASQGSTSNKDKEKKKKKAKLPPEPLIGARLANAQYNFSFSPSGLKGVTLENPTSLQFGPDRRLYVSQQNGLIKALTIRRDAANDYTVTATEEITLINSIPNHDDNGQVNPGVTTRQVTGILVTGTSNSPVLYVSSSDSRIGGPGGDLNLDTNSGIVSRLTRSGTTWSKMDLVRGLPRSEENHASNGMQLDNNILYLAQGGHTNAGSPSTNFAYTPEYALSAAILSINLAVIDNLPTLGSGNTAYKYDLPTLDDPDRPNQADGTDPFDPFGGNDGLNQAKLLANGPVQVFSPGYRNPYDLVITKNRKVYTIDNGANQGWGGYPENEGKSNATNNYVNGEPGSSSPAPNGEGTVNNLDNLHYIGDLATYQSGSYYGGHPTPTRANPASAGLYTHDGNNGVFRTLKTGANPLPVDWPPVPLAKANPIEGDYEMPGTAASKSLLTFPSSTNGLCEYTASNFSGAMQGSLLACSFDGDIVKISLTADGTNVTNPYDAGNKLNTDLPFASGFGSTPLDVTAQGDADIFPGSVWAATYGSNAITIFEPQDFLACTGNYDANDDDQDGYTNADEIDNRTQPCSAASRPTDSNNNNISDLNDSDDDSDGLADNVDFFSLDKDNGLTTNLPIRYDLFNNYPGTGLFGLGFTGLMSNGDSIYSDLFEEQNLTAGGAVGSFSVTQVSPGDALGSLNTQENGFQFGVSSTGSPFTVQGRLLGPFFNGKTPVNFQSQGIYLGNGDQNNYLKIAITANGGVGGLQVVYENAGVPVTTNFTLPGGPPTSTLDLYFAVNPATGMVQPKYAANGGAITNLGNPIQVGGALLAAIQSGKAYAVGLIATSRNAPTFTAVWDFVYITSDQVTALGTWTTIAPTTGTITSRQENAYVDAGNKFYLLGGRGTLPVQEYNPTAKAWATKAAPPVELNHFQAVTLDGLIYAVGAMNGTYPREIPVANVYVYNPASDKWKVGSTIPQARRRGSAGTVVYKDKIYVVAGITDGHWAGWVPWFDQYDPATNTWKALPDAPRARDHFNATVINDKLYLIGGRRSSSSTNQPVQLTVPEVDVYDFATGKWSTLPSASNLPTPRAGAATAVLGTEILVMGGESSLATAHRETHALDVTTNTWRRVADLQSGRHSTQAIVNNSGIYVAAGAANQGGTSLATSQEAFYFFNPTTPNGTALTPSKLTATTANLDYGFTAPNTDSTRTLKLTNAEGNQAVLVSAITLSGAPAFTYTSPYTLPFVVPVGKSVELPVKFSPTVAGTQTGKLLVSHSGQGDTIATALKGGGTATALYQIHSGGGALSTAFGPFAADQYFSSSSETYATDAAIGGTSDDALYQAERYGKAFSYAFPVSSGQQYRVVLHFAEIYGTQVGQRVFDVNLEGAKVLDNYDIYKKVGTNVATTEAFVTTVADDVLNVSFSSLAADGGVDNAKISAIEVYRLSQSSSAVPTANAGADKTITLPTNSTALSGSGTDTDGTIASYAWTQVSGPNTALFTSKTVAAPSVSNLIAGAYVFSLIVTDNSGTPSIADQVTVTVNAASTGGATAVHRIRAGGTALATSIGNFTADQYFSGGNAAGGGNAIAGTTDDALYQTERWGSMTYALPVANGQYTVRLHFAEIYWGSPGQRVFDVTAEGTKVLSAYDILKKVGQNTATTETFAVTVSDGVLTLAFAPGPAGADEPKVSAIEVLTTGATNQAPVANAGPDKTITLPTASTLLSGVGTDADGTVATYAWTQVSGPNTATFNSKTVAQPTVSGLIAGAYVFSLIVTDNAGLASTADQVTVTVNPANVAPVANAGTDQTITLPTASTALNGTGTDSDGTIASYAWTQISGPNTATFTSKTVAAPTVSGLAAGSYVFSLIVTDNAGSASAADQVTVTVSPANAAPVANAGADKTVTLPTSSTTLDGSGTDANGTIASYAWTQVSGPNTAVFTSKTVAVPTVSGLIAGSYVFSLIVTDNAGLASTADQVTVIVNPANVAPVANAGTDKTVTLPVSSATLDGSGTDSDGTVASYAWTQVSGPNTATFTSKTVAQPTVSGFVAGSYVFSLIVTDNAGLASTADQMTVIVNPAATSAPTANAGPDKAVTLPTASTTLDGSGISTSGTIASYAWTQVSGPNTATFTSKTVAVPTVSGLVAGAYVFSLIVTDNAGLASAADQVTVTVTTGNAAPVANAGADKTVTLPTSTTTLNGSGTDSNGTIASYAWTQISGPNTATFTSKTVAAPTVSGLAAGSYVFSLIVTDNQGLASTADQVTVTVNAANAAPVANAGVDKIITLPTNSTILSGSGTDANGTVASYAWTQVSGPNTATFTSKTVAQPTVSGLVAGSYVFSLIVTDNQGLASTADQMTVTVNPAPTGGVTAVYRLNAGGPAVTTSIGAFTADQNVSGGFPSGGGGAIGGTTDDVLYQTERWGTMSYNLPVSNGTYTVRLHFAEVYWGAPNQRVFDVALEGTKVLTAYDILKKVNKNTATIETFTATVTDGILNIAFSRGTAGADEPKVSAIEVLTTGTAARTSASTTSTSQSATVQAVALANVSAQVVVYPNPSEDGRYQVQLPAVFQGEVNYQLVSTQGVLVRSGKATLNGGALLLDFSQQMLAEGMYHLQLTGAKAQAHVKLLHK